MSLKEGLLNFVSHLVPLPPYAKNSFSTLKNILIDHRHAMVRSCKRQLAFAHDLTWCSQTWNKWKEVVLRRLCTHSRWLQLVFWWVQKSTCGMSLLLCTLCYLRVVLFALLLLWRHFWISARNESGLVRYGTPYRTDSVYAVPGRGNSSCLPKPTYNLITIAFPTRKHIC